jgi:hypothetical protein
MEQVIVEWSARKPYTPETLRAASAGVSWCHRIHNVTHLRSYLGGDGTRLVCVFAAPDAEAVRRAGRQAGSPVHTIWTAAVHLAAPAADAAVDNRPVVLVGRRFDQPAEFAALHAIEAKGSWCLDQHNVRHLRSYASLDGQRFLCLYEAPDAETVREVQRTVGLPFERAWSATQCVWANGPAAA